MTKSARPKARSSSPKGQHSTLIDKRYRVALPAQLPWHVGMRVYFSLTQSDPPGVVVSRLPIRPIRNRLMSIRVQRIYHGLVRKRRVKNKTAADVKGIVKVKDGRRLSIDEMRP